MSYKFSTKNLILNDNRNHDNDDNNDDNNDADNDDNEQKKIFFDNI